MTFVDTGLPTAWQKHFQPEVLTYELEAFPDESKLRRKQREIFNQFVSNYSENVPISWIIRGHSGTGKTFLLRAMAKFCNANGGVALCVASSGVAALQFPGGRAAHSVFRIPLSVSKTSVCLLEGDCKVVRLLKKKVVIIWDEIQMQNRFCIEAVDRAMRRIRKNNRLFGGAPIVFGGDFLMTLPEVDQAASVGLEWDEVGEPPAHASLEESYIWDKLDEHLLEKNQRLVADEKNRRFISWWNDNLLRNVGSSASLPSDVNISDNLESFVKKVYSEDVLNGRAEHDAFADHCILSTTEESAAAINLTALKLQIENQHSFSFRAFDVPEDE
ncbi:uncharacterized protein PgNI_11638, partial [Pyricularia grisea]|uniref:ATP-dependent DNA helicase n=1 Tax=Pyricularia grisea TaxID=148305 RepID=A0A6P8ANL7_PYRGI